MANIFRKTYAKPLPEAAEVFTRRGKKMARWTDGRGRTQTAPLASDRQRVVLESEVWYARYRDVDGVEQRRSTRCRDEQAARHVLANMLAKAEKVRSGVLTPEASQAAGHASRPLPEHFADYLAYLKAKTVRGRKVSAEHLYNVDNQLARLADECGFRRIGDITRQRVIRWMNKRSDCEGMAPRTINTHRAALVAFCNWAVKDKRLANNPLNGLPKADESEVRRQRRALSPQEIAALLDAAASRPLQAARTIRRGKNKGKRLAKVRAKERARLERLGRERALIYKTMIYTGLRKGELASLTVASLHLDAQSPYAELSATKAKSGRGARIPIRADLAEDLRNHLAEKLSEHRRRTLAEKRTEYPNALPGSMPVFNVPRDFIRVFDRDLKGAGIPKTDQQGRTVDIHCLRHTFATMLSQAGVAPRLAQELLRHSDIRLTMNTYTHLQLVDTSGAVEALPNIHDSRSGDEAAKRTGTDDRLCGAENGAEISAEVQEMPVSPRQALASYLGWPIHTDTPQTLAEKEQRKPSSTPDKGFCEAGERIRTANNQLGRLELCQLSYARSRCGES